MSKLLFIGIDALDSVQIERYADHLPNISRLRREGFYSQFESVWPPDSETVWATIYTGWNPARHGVFRFIDPLAKTSSYMSQERDNSVFRGRTFWDLASRAGRQVCILFPHVGYPSWSVNGLMATRASVSTDVSITSTDGDQLPEVTGLNDVKGLAGRRRQQYLNANRNVVERQLAFNIQLLRQRTWDLVFSYWSVLDLIQHQFWAHCDPADPTFPGRTPFQHAIRDFYMLHDQVIGRLRAEVDADTTVIVMSDHGHGMRPIKIFNVNRMLCEHGLLTLKSRKGGGHVQVLKLLKKHATEFVSRYELGDLAANVLKFAPWTKDMYVNASNIDFDRTVACTTDMSGIKAYSYGGINIARENLEGRSYESICDRIINIMIDASVPGEPEVPMVRWIKRRHELYQGPYIEEYPDLVFDLHPDYGVGWDAEGPLFTVSHSHTLYPGSHVGPNAVFMMDGPALKRVERPPATMMDVAPTVLQTLNVPVPKDFDGRSILAEIQR